MINIILKRFRFFGQDATKHPCKGVIVALNSAHARAQLQQQGMTITKIGRLWWYPPIRATAMTSLLRQLAWLLHAGIPLLTCLSTLAKQQRHTGIIILLQSLSQQIQQGASLSSALQHFPNTVDLLTCQLIQAGEQSGKLVTLLQRAAEQREQHTAMKQRLRAASLYPAIVIVIALLVSTLLLTLVIPHFAKLFYDNHITLPSITQNILILSHQLHHHGLILLLLLLLLIEGCIATSHRSQRFAQLGDDLLLHLPLVGSLIKRIILVRTLETLTLSYSAGIPLLTCLTLSANVANHHRFSSTFLSIRQMVKNGQPLSVAMRDATYFPVLIADMVASGEKSGQLAELLNSLTQQYRKEIDQRITHLMTLLEPTIMVILGGVIGWLLVAIYLPIFQLGRVI